MITTLFFIFVILVVFHFIYDGIIAPSLRHEIRLELFELRDRLRMLKIEHNEQLSDELFAELQDTINKQIRILHEINILGVIEAIQFSRNNNEMDAEIRNFETLLNNCELEEIKDISNKTAFAFMKAIAANSGGWAIFVIPVALIGLVSLVAIGRIMRLMWRILRSPDDKLVPFDRNAYV